jgi:hypothetical protein
MSGGAPKPDPPVLGYATQHGVADFRQSTKQASHATFALSSSACISGLMLVTCALTTAVYYFTPSGSHRPPVPQLGLSIYLWLFLLSIPLSLVSFALLLIWQEIAYAKLRALGYAPPHSPRETIAQWFIPGLNLYRPWRTYRELLTNNGEHPTRGNAAGLWWFTLLLATALNFCFLPLTDMRTSVGDQVLLLLLLRLITDLLYLLANIQLIRIIHRILALQNAH